MNGFAILGSFQKRALFLLLLVVTALLTLAAAVHYATPLNGIPSSQVRYLDSGWFYEEGGRLLPIAQLPCRVDVSSGTLHLTRNLSDAVLNPDDVLAIETRYQSIRVWADQTLIYEAAQGQAHALSSMWHFIPSERYGGASTLRIELTKYESGSEWELFHIMQDNPDTIGMHLLKTHLPTILMWMFCMLFTLLLVVVVFFMVIRKIAGASLILSLGAFIFLSGMWILLDSKISTTAGGNYALTYFFSYCAFYLLPAPLLFYFQLMLRLKNRLLRYLVWITVGNAGFWMLLHLLGVVSIRSTATSVHLIIILFLIVFVGEFIKKGEWKKRPVYTFWGILVIFSVALISIILYYTGLLPPANSAVVYIWGLLALIFCMILDTVVTFGRMWKEMQYMAVYQQLATEDSMTKLANRNAYELRLRELVSDPPQEVSLILFDIDRMKHINDTYGHHIGDQAIALTAQCIHDVFGALGDCYRIGGDEFCVILTSPDQISLKPQQSDALIADRNKGPFLLGVSHGWETRRFASGTPIAQEDIVALKAAADQNLYRDKNGNT